MPLAPLHLVARLIVAAVLCAGLVACTQHPLSALDQASDIVLAYGSVDARICTDPPSPSQQKLKYLFILDHSASNQPGFPLSANDVTSTDPQGSRRYGTLVNFIRGLTPNVNTPTSFNLIDFDDIATQPTGITTFNPDTTSFLAAVTTDWIGGGTAQVPAPDDHGFTNYQSALQLAFQLIKTDVQAEAASAVQPPIKSLYVVIFVSDGVPTIVSGSSVYTQTFATDISPVETQIMNLKQDASLGPLISDITVNTAYYDNGTEIVAAEQLLEQMATLGNGQYLQFDSGQNILYQQFAPAAREIINNLVDVFVQNVNAVWWSDGKFYYDGDGDGIPDVIESQLGSNPKLADSDGNGVSDLVEYRTKGAPCNDAHCAASGRDPYAICAGFSPSTDASGRVTFSSSTNDGLNDCEKFLLVASRTSYNTNGDLIPDAYAFTSWLPVIAGSQSIAFADPFLDGITNYNKLKQGLPIQVSKNSLLDFTPRTTSLVREASSEADVACYHLNVDQIALSAAENQVRLMLVQNSAAVQDKPYLKNARKTLSLSNLTATFSPGDFTTN